MSSQTLPFDSDTESVQSGLVKRSRKGKLYERKRNETIERNYKRKNHKESIQSSDSESEREETKQKKPRKSAEKKEKVQGIKKKKPSPLVQSDSDDFLEEEDPPAVIAQKLQNLLWRRVASGYTSQRNYTKKGEFYIDFKISYSSDAQLKDGYKKTLITFKSCTSKGSEVYKAAEKLITAAKKEYKDITPLLYPNPDL